MKNRKQDKEIMMRILESAYLDRYWEDAEKFYGKKATAKLRTVAPADPFLLRDMARFSYRTDGKTDDEIDDILSEYTHDNWAYDMDNFAETIKKVKKLAIKDLPDNFDSFATNL